MDFYFSPRAPSSSNLQTYYTFQSPVLSGTHNQVQNYFNMSPAKPSPLFKEDPFKFLADVESHQTGNFSSSEFTSFDNLGNSPLYAQPAFDKELFSNNFNFSLDFASEGFQQSMDNLKPSSQDIVAQGPMQCEQSEQSESAPVITTNNFKSGIGLKGWSEEDETLLRKLVVQYKFDWKKIAKKFENKKYTAHFLKMRYRGNDEGPVPKRVKFSHEEDMLIAKCFNEYGVDWENMVSHFPNRTAVMLKNRYYSHIRKNKKLESLLKELQDQESNIVSQAVSQFGDNTELSATCSEDNFSQVQFEIVVTEEKPKKDEVALLKEQLKSMKKLYASTYKELAKLRGHQGTM